MTLGGASRALGMSLAGKEELSTAADALGCGFRRNAKARLAKA
jgi:hypothetical protein